MRIPMVRSAWFGISPGWIIYFLTGGKKAMLQKVKAFFEKKFPFLFDDDLYFKVRDIFRLLGDLIVWPYNYVKSFFK